GLAHTLHSFRAHHYLGSGQAHKVLQEAGIHADGQLQAILKYATQMERRSIAQDPSSQGTPFPMGNIRFAKFEKIKLTCATCGTEVDPLEHFRNEPLPTDEYCLDCEHRDPQICPYCKAYWLLSKSATGFNCHKCAA
ncbi:MAG: hypothetical protein ACE5G1_17405, partial [bacterium]